MNSLQKSVCTRGSRGGINSQQHWATAYFCCTLAPELAHTVYLALRVKVSRGCVRRSERHCPCRIQRACDAIDFQYQLLQLRWLRHSLELSASHHELIKA